MGAISKRAYLVLLARLVLAAVFLWAALPKIQDPIAFVASVEAFRVVGSDLSMWTALMLPWLELVIGVGLLIPQIRRSSGLIIIVLLAAFICLHASAWVRGLDISCGCFGANPTDETPNYLWLIVRNGALLIAATAVFVRDLRNPRFAVETKEASIS